MAFFPEIDVKKTVGNADRKLNEYLKCRRIASDAGGQKVTQEYKFMPRSKHSQPNKPVEKLAINRVDAEAELDAIESAVSRILDPLHRRLLFERYMVNPRERLKVVAFCDLTNISETQYRRELEVALLSFAEQYRNSSLVEVA